MNVNSKQQALKAIDRHLARFLTRLSGGDSREICLAVHLLNAATREGNVCLDLEAVAGRPLLLDTADDCPEVAPELDAWCRILRKSPIVGTPGDFKPLILDDSQRLYLYRYWDDERQTKDFFRQRMQQESEQGKGGIYVGADDQRLRSLQDGLRRLFPGNVGQETDWQKVAALLALLNNFAIVTGSPGTGKTTTVLKMLVLFIEFAQSRPIRIALAAPTGKAAVRLQEAIGRARETLNCSDAVKDAIPQKAYTIHRLLGTIPDSTRSRHNNRNPLPYEVLIIDEASMVDLHMMAKVIAAIPAKAILILIGDRDQLASVDAGAVLGDLCGEGLLNRFSMKMVRKLQKVLGSGFPPDFRLGDSGGMQDHIVELVKNYRFDSKSGIGRISQFIKNGDADGFIKTIKMGDDPDIQWSGLPAMTGIEKALAEAVIEGFEGYLCCFDRKQEYDNIYRSFERFRILCALREGPFGSANINRQVEDILRSKRLIRADNRWYIGRPIMITKNDYNLGLFNGDTGIIVKGEGSGWDRVALFEDPLGRLRSFSPARLPEHETAFAMTVHKSQGSEFDRLLIILPDRDFPFLTREILYTAISRAKKSLLLWGDEHILRKTVSRRIARTSGLHDALWKTDFGIGRYD